ncbi:MAG: D-alanine--D-alanine ligase [Gemmataceae bacterium]|nr:D-alanine--D-alanine ligase [Gemmataceae bacterium]MCI0743163.1 D-alanine--D-alanine ligase [Gemmataceae bacterium]
MKIGITFDLKTAGPVDGHAPDDLQEEFDSPHTIEAIAAALRGLGHRVVLLGDNEEFLRKVLDDPPDFVFNFAEGTGVSRSREARVPAVLEMLGIPFTGSDPLTMAVTLDKDCAKKLVAATGVAVAWGIVVGPDQDPLERLKPATLPFPVVVKPVWEGSSKGIRKNCFVKTPNDLPGIVESLRRDHRQPIMIEPYLPGDELTVGIYGNSPPRILGVMKVSPKQKTDHFIYSLEIKRDYRRLVDYECPAKLRPRHLELVERAALDAYWALGCRDVARVDFRLDEHGTPHFLEVNPLPGLNPDDSDLVIMANLVGWSYSRLIETIVNAALERYGLK